MLAPRPTKNDTVEVLLPCLTDCSAESAATVVVTVYLPFTAVQVPSVADTLPPALMTPPGELVSVFTVTPVESLMVTVTPCVALDDGWLPWLVTTVVKVTVLPADGLPGDHVVDATRSALWIGATVNAEPE